MELDLFKESIKEIIAYYIEKNASQYVSYNHYQKYEQGGIVTKFKKDFGWLPSKTNLIEAINKNLFSTKQLIIDILKEPNLNLSDNYSSDYQINNNHEVNTYDFNTTINDILRHYFDQTQDLIYVDEIVNDIFRDFNRNISDEIIYETAYVPLIRFKVENDNFKFKENLIIEKITEDEINQVYLSQKNYSYNLLSNSDLLIGHTNYKLSYKYQYSKAKNEIIQQNNAMTAFYDAYFTIKNTVTSLRLADKEEVNPFTIFFKMDESKKYLFPHLYHPIFSRHNLEFCPTEKTTFIKYILTQEKGKKAQELFEILNDPKNSEKLIALKFGLEKFNQSFTRISQDDQIIDYVSILDSTVLYNSRNSNFYKLCIRTSLIVPEFEGFETFEFVSALTDFRNEIIHSGKSFKELFNNKIKVKLNRDDLNPESYIRFSKYLIQKVLNFYLENLIKRGGDIGTINSNKEKEFFSSKFLNGKK